MDNQPTYLDTLLSGLWPETFGQAPASPSEIARMSLGALSLSPIGRAGQIGQYLQKPASVQDAAKRVVEAVVPAADDAAYSTISPQASQMAKAARDLSLWDKAKDAIGQTLDALGF